jgi:hypothetical protein
MAAVLQRGQQVLEAARPMAHLEAPNVCIYIIIYVVNVHPNVNLLI